MFRRIVALSLLITAVSVGTAAAEPKNQAPFTRSLAPATVDAAPRPEAKNLLPFTRRVVVDAEARPEAKDEVPFTRHVGADATTSTASSGFDWTLTAWAAIAAIALAGGMFALTRLRVWKQKPA